MTLEQLRIFVEAARFGSFTLAAGRLGLTQSAVSISIRKLEEHLAVALFRRASSGLLLTEAGRALFDEAGRILNDVALTALRVRGMNDPQRGRLVVGCSRNAYDCWMPDILARLEGRPDVPPMEIVVGCADDVTAWVMRGTADLGLAEREPGHPQLAYWEVFADSLKLYAAAALAPSLPRAVQWQDLEALAPLLWESDTDLGRCLLGALLANQQSGKRLRHDKLRFTSSAAVLSALQAGRHAGFLGSRLARPHVASGRLAEIGDLEIPVRYWLFGPRHGDIEAVARIVAHAAAGYAQAGEETQVLSPDNAGQTPGPTCAREALRLDEPM